MESKSHGTGHSSTEEQSKHYKKLLLMAVLSFIAMYVLMYAMVNTFSNVFPNVNQFYMAGLMASPMVVIEIVIMSAMYMNKKLNGIIISVSIFALMGFYLSIRQQVGVSDRQFLKSMIPHHAGAILMCNGANLNDPELKQLCEEIVSSQQREIEQMKAKLNEIEK